MKAPSRASSVTVQDYNTTMISLIHSQQPGCDLSRQSRERYRCAKNPGDAKLASDHSGDVCDAGKVGWAPGEQDRNDFGGHRGEHQVDPARSRIPPRLAHRCGDRCVQVRGASGVWEGVELIEYFPVACLANGRDERVVVMDPIREFSNGERADAGRVGQLLDSLRENRSHTRCQVVPSRTQARLLSGSSSTTAPAARISASHVRRSDTGPLAARRHAVRSLVFGNIGGRLRSACGTMLARNLKV